MFTNLNSSLRLSIFINIQFRIYAYNSLKTSTFLLFARYYGQIAGIQFPKFLHISHNIKIIM